MTGVQTCALPISAELAQRSDIQIRQEPGNVIVMQNSPRLADIGCVFHLGACSATTERDASYLIRNNFEYTKELAEWALSRGARFVYASSAATYGDGAAGMSDSADLADLQWLAGKRAVVAAAAPSAVATPAARPASAEIGRAHV